METIHERVAGLDVHKDTVVACVRVPGSGGRRESHIHEFSATTAGLLALADWLDAHRVSLVGMEATGAYWKPVYYALEEGAECRLLNGLLAPSVPASAQVGEQVQVAVSSRDAWSALAAPSWDFGEGSSATGTTAAHAYAAPGTYTVTVTQADALGNSSSASAQIQVSAPPPGPAAGTPLCRSVAAAPPPARAGSPRFSLSAAQLLTNQRIGQAAIRRLNGVRAWLDAGIEGRDVCGGAIGAAKLGAGISTALASAPLAAPRPPEPPPVEVARARPGAGRVSVSAAQLLINQRIYQAAVRRASALEERLGRLTGGDLAPGALGQETLAPLLRVTGAAPAPEPAPSSTVLPARRPGPRGTVRLSVGQLRINQRVAQAAVRRANALIARLEAGLSGENFADASITARSLAPGVAPAP
jgi:PKD repeat protein